MGYIIFHIFITFFAVTGFIETAHFLITLPLKNHNAKSYLIITPESDKIEYELRSYTSKLRWPGNLQPKKIYCIDDNLTEEAKEICRLMTKEYSFIETISSSQIKELINSK